MKLSIPFEVYKQLVAYIRCADTEVSGMGLVELANRNVTVTRIFLPKQECTGSHTEFKRGEVANIMATVKKDGGDPSNLRFWWHSHHTLSAFFSGLDEATIEDFGDIGFDYLVSLVGNIHGDFQARIDLFKPIRLTVNLEIEIVPEFSKAFISEIKNEIKAKVFRKTLEQFNIYDYDGYLERLRFGKEEEDDDRSKKG